MSDETTETSGRPYYETAARVGARLREERLAQDIRLKELASKTGLSYQQLSAIERGWVNTPIETLNRIAASLGLMLDDVIQSPGGPRTVTPHICATLRETETKVSEALHLVQTLTQTLCPSA